ncbi:MAG: ABC transporter permease [Candidatus Woesearchaeota archaeon]
MIRDYFLIPWKELRRRKLRSWLTLIGVFIGIAAIISLISLGQGLQNAITSQLSSLGTDKLMIMAKGSSIGSASSAAVKLTDQDVKVVRRTPGIKAVTGVIYTTGRIEINNVVRYNFVEGIPTVQEEGDLFNSMQGYKLLSGRGLQSGDKYKVVLGYEYTNPDQFGRVVNVGEKILIKDESFKVVGIYKKIGSPPDDKAVIIPIEAYQEVFNKPNEISMMVAQTDAGEDPSLVAEEVKKELRDSRNVKEKEEDFTVQTPEQLFSSFGTILDIVQIVLIGIASISLLVGGINIMNTMYTSVLQRTKEIGVMKALGAKNVQVMSLFLVEAGFYGLGGGIVGVTGGMLIAKLVEFAVTTVLGPYLVITFSWGLIFGTLGFSFLVGALSGLAPAYKASRLSPVDSLRYE